MNKKVKKILDQISVLEEELRNELKEHELQAIYELNEGKAFFEKKIKEAHRRLRMGIFSWIRTSRPQNVLSTPFIYIIIVPLVFLDISMTIYQAICFRLYGIPAVKRSDYISLDRHRLSYLNLLEKINCDYCGYANGLFAYFTEIGARTEQYWCPIKHARKNLIVHKRYPYFIDYGDANKLHARFDKLRILLNQSIEKEKR
ncbi:hypothetical protein [Leptospira tipperaryensis]|uniref:hypothetical protein n=1 Tax=Leptospira tipperaryensis TaxID=2564040 RepID=UPI00084C3903|nr:hypothetical protein [Leptospira tipperaryensis]